MRQKAAPKTHTTGAAIVLSRGRGRKHWERGRDVGHVVQAGAARGLSLSTAHVTHPANAAQGGADIDRIYLIIEYPLALHI